MINIKKTIIDSFRLVKLLHIMLLRLLIQCTLIIKYNDVAISQQPVIEGQKFPNFAFACDDQIKIFYTLFTPIYASLKTIVIFSSIRKHLAYFNREIVYVHVVIKA